MSCEYRILMISHLLQPDFADKEISGGFNSDAFNGGACNREQPLPKRGLPEKYRGPVIGAFIRSDRSSYSDDVLI